MGSSGKKTVCMAMSIAGLAILLTPVFFDGAFYKLFVFAGALLLVVGVYSASVARGTEPLTAKERSGQKVFRLGSAALLLVVALCLFVKSFLKYEAGIDVGYCLLGSFALMGSLAFYVYSSERVCNKMTSVVKRIDTMEASYDAIMADFGELETPLGKVWQTEIKLVGAPAEVLVYGPESDGSFVYLQYLNGNFYLNASDRVKSLVDQGRVQRHKIAASRERIPHVKEAHNVSEALLPWYEEMFREYSKGSRPAWPLK